MSTSPGSPVVAGLRRGSPHGGTNVLAGGAAEHLVQRAETADLLVVVCLDDSDLARAAPLEVQEAGRTDARVDAVLAYEALKYLSDQAPVMGPVDAALLVVGSRSRPTAGASGPAAAPAAAQA